VTKTVVTPEEGAELQRLYREHAAATETAVAVLAARGMDSPEFAEADKAAGVIWRRMREILGDAGKHWMS
jgi:hypothetical protein